MDYGFPNFVNKVDAVMVYGIPPITYLFRYTYDQVKIMYLLWFDHSKIQYFEWDITELEKEICKPNIGKISFSFSKMQE